jgi:hypothetical protein
MTDPLYHEVFVQYRAWQDLVRDVLLPGADALTADPLKIHEALQELDNDAWNRLAHLMVANGHADTVTDGVRLLVELRAYAECGRRPRYAYEAGLSFGEFDAARERRAS